MIRKHIWLLLPVAICLAVPGTCVAKDDEEFENLVQNADFEDFGQAPWTMWVEDASAVATVSIDRKESLTGDQSLLIDIGKKGGGMRVELHQNPFNLENGQRLTYAFWAKVEEGEVRPARMIVNHRADPWTSYGSKDITITEEWTEFFVPVVMTANDSNVGIYVELRDTVGSVWFDRFRLYEGEYIEEELDELPDRAVEPNSKLTTTWSAVRAGSE
jgi:hypothetical protein